MKVYFITRFSIYDPEFGGFRLTKDNDPKEYERRLFDKSRLNHKFDTFQNITFPSIVQQTCDDWEWIIYASDRMHDKYMKRLRTLVKDYTNIVLIIVKNFSEFFEKTSSYNYEKTFATVRIDDDDGLSNCFVDKLQQYSKKVGSIVSFTEGKLAKYVNGKLIIGKKVSEKNNAQGLAGIGINIYNCGSHSDIDKRFNVIYDRCPDMFFLTCSPFTDTQRGFTALNRIMVRLERLLFLVLRRPDKVPKECAIYIRKLVRH
jgi:hypothetical protein